MNIPSLRYHINNAQIGMNHSRPNTEIRQREADLRIDVKEGNFQIKTTPGQLEIDQSQAFKDVGIMDVFERTEQFVSKAKGQWYEGVARIAREGNQMMKIENGGNAIPRIAKQNSQPNIKQAGLGYLPSSHFAVKINIEPTKVDINIEPNKVQIDSKTNPPQFKYNRWEIDTYLKQEPFIDIEYIGNHIDKKY
ncbi:DUF6470 family protein [Bacillus sp. AK128]